MSDGADGAGAGPDDGRTATDDGRTATGDGRTATDDERQAESGGVVATYEETDAERLLRFEATSESAAAGRSTLTTAAIAQNLDGYAMLAVRPSPEGEELERYYGFEMALDHVSELLGVPPGELPVPGAAADMGM